MAVYANNISYDNNEEPSYFKTGLTLINTTACKNDIFAEKQYDAKNAFIAKILLS